MNAITGPVPDKPILICRPGMTRTDALLAAWAEWRRIGRYDAVHPSSDSWLGRLVKVVKRSNGEELLPPSTMPQHDDELMEKVSRVVSQMPPDRYDKRRIRQVVVEHYCGPGWWTVLQKSHRCKVSRRTYYRNLDEGREIVDAQVKWQNVLIVEPEEVKRRICEASGC